MYALCTNSQHVSTRREIHLLHYPYPTWGFCLNSYFFYSSDWNFVRFSYLTLYFQYFSLFPQCCLLCRNRVIYVTFWSPSHRWTCLKYSGLVKSYLIWSQIRNQDILRTVNKWRKSSLVLIFAVCLFNLTLSHTTNCTVFQTERVCRRHFHIWWKWQKVLETGRKHCGKRRNWSLRAIPLFPTAFSKDLYCRHVKIGVCLGKGWKIKQFLPLWVQYGYLENDVFCAKPKKVDY